MSGNAEHEPQQSEARMPRFCHSLSVPTHKHLGEGYMEDTKTCVDVRAEGETEAALSALQ